MTRQGSFNVLVSFALFAAPVQLLQARRDFQRNGVLEPCMGRLGVRWVLLLSAIVFLGWIPYMVIYWPGFILAILFHLLARLWDGLHWTTIILLLTRST